MIDGEGDPNSDQYREAIEHIYPVAYSLKFMLKKTSNPEYVVPPLESLWWAKDMDAFTKDEREQWLWTAMLRQPKFITKAFFDRAIAEVKAKKPELTSLDKLRLMNYEEGLTVQIMHIGPYTDEGPDIEWMHEFAGEQGYELRGKHHEVYISDPRKTAPEKLKTVLRQPIE